MMKAEGQVRGTVRASDTATMATGEISD
jgi:hypothetical protein